MNATLNHVHLLVVFVLTMTVHFLVLVISVSRELDLLVQTLMSVLMMFVARTQPVKIQWVHSRVPVCRVTPLLATFVSISMNVKPKTLAIQMLHVRIQTVVTIVPVMMVILDPVLTVSMSMNAMKTFAIRMPLATTQ